MTSRERAEGILEHFRREMPDPQPELRFGSPYQLLVAVILSAQCTDVRVNKVTPALFEAFPTVATLAAAEWHEVLPFIASCSYPNAKARHLVGMAQRVVGEFGGEIPSSLSDLMSLPGVGRKTANVILAVAFGIPAIAVDTHVHRVAQRLGLTVGAKTPDQTEGQLQKCIPQDLWSQAHHWLILHGRYVCLARRPLCDACFLRALCRHVGVE